MELVVTPEHGQICTNIYTLVKNKQEKQKHPFQTDGALDRLAQSVEIHVLCATTQGLMSSIILIPEYNWKRSTGIFLLGSINKRKISKIDRWSRTWLS